MNNTKTKLEPILLVDSHHGIYSAQICLQSLNNDILRQVRQQVSNEDLGDILDGPGNEFYFEAFESLEQCNIEFEGTNWTIQQNEDIWLVPEGYEMEII
jgi:hypothetical protein